MIDDWRIWQLADSAFPSGGLAHSSGVEAAVQAGLIADAEALEDFVKTAARQIEVGVLVFVDRAWQEPESFADLDLECDLFLNNHIANRASRAQGKAFLASAWRTFEIERIESLSMSVRLDRRPGHFAPVFGFVSRMLEVPKSVAASLYLYMSVRSSLSSAVRLGVIGPIEAQRIQARMSDKAESSSNQQLPIQSAPLLDLLQAGQDRLYSRLFQS